MAEPPHEPRRDDPDPKSDDQLLPATSVALGTGIGLILGAVMFPTFGPAAIGIGLTFGAALGLLVGTGLRSDWRRSDDQDDDSP